MGNKTNGLLALLGLGAAAYWKYKNSTPEQQQAVKDKINTAKENLSNFGNNLKGKASDLADQAKGTAADLQDKASDAVS